jgi:hypothetical protein
VALALLGALFLAASGCGSAPDYQNMSEQEKAKLVAKKRKAADDAWTTFLRSENNPDGIDLESLEKFTRLHKETTEIYPGACPRCYGNYAQGLRALGRYYWVLREKNKDDLRSAPPEARPAIEANIVRYDEKVKSYYREANRQLEMYFRLETGVDPTTYQWALQQYEELGDYRQALHYLDLFLASAPRLTEDDQAKLDRARQQFLAKLERQRQKEIEDELRQ